MKIILSFILIAIFAGCSVFPSTTSVSATSKVNNADNPTVKVQQNFKWTH